MSFEDNQIDKICRTCLSEGNTMRSVFTLDDSTGDSIPLFEMLMSFTSVEVIKIIF